MDYRFGSSPEPSEPDDPRRPRPDFSPVDAFKQLVQIPTYTSAAFLDPVDIDGESDSVAQYRCESPVALCGGARLERSASV